MMPVLRLVEPDAIPIRPEPASPSPPEPSRSWLGVFEPGAYKLVTYPAAAWAVTPPELRPPDARYVAAVDAWVALELGIGWPDAVA